ncbi:hypothetical protein BGAL_0453g00030 [Botrytis galanthina]|uniref:DNA2/NAM7 helicase-like C-terminal domain-containing protein n=1 Tax=Botrytis galanthina TaxID=278940 RepID=A0A4S8QNV9_9HELO|nr:hypothetical protein BGAL_0453g00030 [Botrytis galanthina]
MFMEIVVWAMCNDAAVGDLARSYLKEYDGLSSATQTLQLRVEELSVLSDHIVSFEADYVHLSAFEDEIPGILMERDNQSSPYHKWIRNCPQQHQLGLGNLFAPDDRPPFTKAGLVLSQADFWQSKLQYQVHLTYAQTIENAFEVANVAAWQNAILNASVTDVPGSHNLKDNENVNDLPKSYSLTMTIQNMEVDMPSIGEPRRSAKRNRAEIKEKCEEKAEEQARVWRGQVVSVFDGLLEIVITRPSDPRWKGSRNLKPRVNTQVLINGIQAFSTVEHTPEQISSNVHAHLCEVLVTRARRTPFHGKKLKQDIFEPDYKDFIGHMSSTQKAAFEELEIVDGLVVINGFTASGKTMSAVCVSVCAVNNTSSERKQCVLAISETNIAVDSLAQEFHQFIANPKKPDGGRKHLIIRLLPLEVEMNAVKTRMIPGQNKVNFLVDDDLFAKFLGEVETNLYKQGQAVEAARVQGDKRKATKIKALDSTFEQAMWRELNNNAGDDGDTDTNRLLIPLRRIQDRPKLEARSNIEYLSPFKAQVHEMNILFKKLGDSRVNASTFKTVQGIGINVVIVDFTRSNRLTDLADDTRDSLVALSRHKHALFVICNNKATSPNSYADIATKAIQLKGVGRNICSLAEFAEGLNALIEIPAPEVGNCFK